MPVDEQEIPPQAPEQPKTSKIKHLMQRVLHHKPYFLALIAAVAVGVSVVIISLFGSSQQPASQSAVMPAYGDGNIAVTFNVSVAKWTPSQDKIYLYIKDYYYGNGGGIPMVRQGQNKWAVIYKAQAGSDIAYKYNRNDYGFPADEQFTPDSKSTYRQLKVGQTGQSVDDQVASWRWLDNPSPEANISTVSYQNLTGGQSLQVGVSLLDFYQPGFDDFVAPTLERIKNKGFKYINIPYSAGTITSVEPLKITDPSNTFSDKQLDFVMSEAEKVGLKLILSSGIETDPNNLSALDEQMSQDHSDKWYEDLVAQWTKAQLDAIQKTSSYDVQLLALSNQWPFWGNASTSQKKLLSRLINQAFADVKAKFKGKLTSDYYIEDPAYDYYKQLDYIGDKWWAPLTQSFKPSVDELQAGANAEVAEKYKPLYQKYGKPIFLSQVAYGAYDGAAGARQLNTEEPQVSEYYPIDDKYPFDYQEQADAYEAVMRTVYANRSMFAGVLSFSYGYWDSHDKSTSIRAKPAEQVWQRWNDILDSQ